MGALYSLRSLFESRSQRIDRLLRNQRFDVLLKMGVDPELLSWHAMRHRDLGAAHGLMENEIRPMVPVSEQEEDMPLAS